MIEKMVENYASSSTFKDWIICLLVFVMLFIYCYPKIKQYVKDAYYKIKFGDDLVHMVKDHDKKIKEHELLLNAPGGINDKLERDYKRLNEIEITVNDSKDENELIVESLLAIIKSLNNISRTEETEEIQDKLVLFLNEKTHK